jgi:DNA-binding XRE family transcriptional regulator
MAMTQSELANRLGMSRKTIVEMEGARAPIEKRTAVAVNRLAQQVHLREDVFWVEQARDGQYAVVRRTVRELPHSQAMFYMNSTLMLYGVFARRDHAYRWAAALQLADNPRNTQSLIRDRNAEAARRSAA